MQFTPTHASWLNQVEIFFSLLWRRLLKHGIFTSEHDLAEQMLAFVETYNQTAKPFKWTYTGKVLSNGSALSAAELALSRCAVVAQSYARDLDEAQDDARDAIEDAREAQRRIDRAQAQLTEARDAGAAAALREAGATAQVLVSGPTGTPDAGAAADLDAARADADAAAALEAGAQRDLEAAQEDLRAACERPRSGASAPSRPPTTPHEQRRGPSRGSPRRRRPPSTPARSPKPAKPHGRRQRPRRRRTTAGSLGRSSTEPSTSVAWFRSSASRPTS